MMTNDPSTHLDYSATYLYDPKFNGSQVIRSLKLTATDRSCLLLPADDDLKHINCSEIFPSRHYWLRISSSVITRRRRTIWLYTEINPLLRRDHSEMTTGLIASPLSSGSGGSLVKVRAFGVWTNAKEQSIIIISKRRGPSIRNDHLSFIHSFIQTRACDPSSVSIPPSELFWPLRQTLPKRLTRKVISLSGPIHHLHHRSLLIRAIIQLFDLSYHVHHKSSPLLLLPLQSWRSSYCANV